MFFRIVFGFVFVFFRVVELFSMCLCVYVISCEPPRFFWYCVCITLVLVETSVSLLGSRRVSRGLILRVPSLVCAIACPGVGTLARRSESSTRHCAMSAHRVVGFVLKVEY